MLGPAAQPPSTGLIACSKFTILQYLLSSPQLKAAPTAPFTSTKIYSCHKNSTNPSQVSSACHHLRLSHTLLSLLQNSTSKRILRSVEAIHQCCHQCSPWSAINRFGIMRIPATCLDLPAGLFSRCNNTHEDANILPLAVPAEIKISRLDFSAVMQALSRPPR